MWAAGRQASIRGLDEARLTLPEDKALVPEFDSACNVWQYVPVTTLVRDSHRLITTLLQRGFSEAQAEAVVEVMKQIDVDGLATKADLQMEIRGLEVRLLKWIIPVLLGQVAVFASVAKWLLV